MKRFYDVLLSAPKLSNLKIEILVNGLLDLRWIQCQIPFISIFELFDADIQAMFHFFLECVYFHRYLKRSVKSVRKMGIALIRMR